MATISPSGGMTGYVSEIHSPLCFPLLDGAAASRPLARINELEAA